MAGTRPPLSLKARAVGYLSRREHSRVELARKLAPHAESAEEVEMLLDALERENWLSNDRFVDSLVHRRASRYGAARVMQEAKTHQLGNEQLRELQDRLRDTEAERAAEVWRKRFGVPPDSPEARAKQIRFMMARGFSRSVIGKIIRGAEDDLDAEDAG
ncbi:MULTISPECIES: recombination regulator RecX [unclassified Cupriavidus]|uniref:recombination regulator RecX n=1 Tax=unclassified Cupriavidus TaxID=2640874 RepID=UPI001C007999|nr:MULTISPECIES: recombination regulator RecX [unclassified Cupriavidus]MCA3187302.1 recombination regulator RecX [Cupriavidus sp.]MCA3190238.1 recombination regulator RecX [Cupriavidus sp.]MCA3196942.1 recombination regulator RecX [Cupriavidus sp.]MCA3202219.1 recombination regulator RecX [Cupriavidus sp.]MCA3208209.1 recombination regulator RecX [Cupriavidus sp.]